MGEYDDIVQGVLDEQKQQANGALYNAAGANPDAEASLLRLSKITGEPLEVLRSKSAEEEAKRKAVAAQQVTPAVAGWISQDQLNANLSHDDTENLGLLDTLGNSFKRGARALSGVADRLQAVNQAEGLTQLDYIDQTLAAGEAVDRTRLGVLGEQYLQMTPEERLQTRQRFAHGMQQNLADALQGVAKTQTDIAAIPRAPVTDRVMKADGVGDAFGAFFDAPFSFLADIGPESLAQSLPGLVAGGPVAAATGPGGFALTMGANSMLTEYANTIVQGLQEAGVDVTNPDAMRQAVSDPVLLNAIVNKAATRGAVVGAFDAASGGLAGVNIVRNVFANIAAQVGVQGVMGAAGEAAATAAVGDKQNPGELLAEFVGEAFTAPVDVTVAAAGKLRGRFQAVQVAEENAKVLAKLDELAKASKVRARDTDTFESFMQSATADGPVTDVYIDGKTLAQSGIAEQVAAVSPAVAEQLAEAVATGGQVRIPVAEYAARIAGTDLSQSLIDHLRTEPEGYSAAEAREFMQSYADEVQAEVERALDAKQVDDAFVQSAQAVEDRVFADLETAGRFKSDVNRAYATLHKSFASAMAQRLNITPEQFWDRYGFSVIDKSLAGEGVLNQGGPSLDETLQTFRDQGVDIFASEKGDVLTLGKLVVPESARGSGAGTAVMQALINYADQNGKHITLTPSEDFGGNKKRLTAFYKRFGFVENKGKNRAFSTSETMYRQAPDKVLYQSAQLPDTIDIDGVQRSTVNSNGKPIAQTEEGVRNFWRWFGDSKVVDEQGRPLVVYHGTFADFTEFDPTRFGNTDRGYHGQGFYFSESPKYAGAYAPKHDGSVMPVYLKIQNPFMKPSRATHGEGFRAEARTRYDALGIKDAQNSAEITNNLQDAGYDGVFVLGNDPYFEVNNASGNFLFEVVAFRPEQIKSAVGNSGAFDPQNPNILQQEARGTFNVDTNTIALLKNADLSTFLHESGHFFLETQFNVAAEIMRAGRAFGAGTNTAGEQQILADTNAILNWFGVNSLDEWFALDFEQKRGYHEQWAESFERYLLDGKAPSIELQGAFQKFRQFMLQVYKSIKDFLARNPAAGKLNDEVRQVFDRMIATDEQIALAEQARSMMPLFTNEADAKAMGIDDFAAYQALGREATAAAVEDLQARTLRDLQWYSNAKQREIRKLKKLSAQRRNEMRIEARREILSQPVYQAWQFLTRKRSADDVVPGRKKSDPNRVDESQDSLFAAISKLGGLDKQEVVDTWGWDEPRTPSPVFGKPLLRKTGGKSIDAMGEALAELGYLTLDEQGKWDNAQLEQLFDDERRGVKRYSSFVDPSLIEDMRPGENANLQALAAGRFDTTELRSMDIAQPIKQIIEDLGMSSATGGLHPDIVAEMFGFTSGDDLIRQLAYAEKPNVAIEGLTDTKMLEQFGELATPEDIERAADAAIHNEVRARMIATEANALAKATGKRALLVSAAREFAAKTISRRKIRDVRPGQFTAGEVRAAKAAAKASASGNITEAASEKRNQLFNNYAARAAYQALEDVERGVRYLKKFDKDSVRKGLTPDYTSQIDALLERFDLRKRSNKDADRQQDLKAWIESQRAAGLEPDIPPALADEAMRKPYREMTVEEFRGLVDTVKQIEHLGRLKNKLLTARDQRSYEAVRDEIANSIIANAGNRKADTRTPTTEAGRWLAKVRNFGWAHIKAATLARVLDGDVDGGPMWEYFVRSANEAGDNEVTMRAKATEDITRILAPVFKAGKLGGKGKFFPSINRSLNRESVIAIALNTGNEGNLQRLLGGEGWTAQQILPVLQSLTAEEWRAVQSVWDYFESYRPQIAAKEMRVYGKEPNWIDPKPMTVVTADGQTVELRGGYYPVKYDPKASQRAEEHSDADAAKRQLQGAYSSATTRRSFTKARAEEVVGRPLLYTLEGVYSGLNEVIHDLSWHEWLIDVNRLLRSHTIDAAIREHYGPEAKAQLKTWVQDIAEGDAAAANAAEMSLARLRQGISAAGLGFNVMNAMMQVTGFIPAGVRIGWKWVAKGATRYIGGPIAATKEANQMSSFMANRARTRLRELNEVRNRVQDANQAFVKVNELAYFMMMRTQQIVDTVTFWGALEKATAEGNDEARAIALAEQAVLDSQGGGQTKDLSAVERGGPALKLFTVYYSYMNTMLNMGVAEQMSPKAKGKKLANQLLIFVIAPQLGLAIKEGLTPDGDDGDEWDMSALFKKMVAEEIGYLMGLMVVVREFADAAKTVAGVNEYARDYGGPAGLRAVSETVRLSTQVQQGEIDDAFIRASINTIGAFSGLPAAQTNRTIAGVEALANDDTDNPAALLFGFQK